MSEKAETKAGVTATTAAPVQEKEVVDDFDFNIDGDETEGTSAVQAEIAKLAPKEGAADNLSVTGTVFESLYGLLLQVVETYLTLSPQSVSQVKFDILRVLDDYVVWDNTVSTAQASLTVRKLNPEVLLSILRVLRQATTSLEVRWFGSQDDAVKMLINVIVAEDWRGAIKRSVLAKLMLLAAPAIQSISRSSSAEMDVEVSSEMEEVARKAKTLLKFVFIQSGLFVGHGLVDFELSTELNTWIGLVSDSDDSVLMVEPLLRVAYHWNTELSILAAQSVTDGDNKMNYLAAVESQGQKQPASHLHEDLTPYSPVLYCAMLLLSSNFQIFSALLPKHIRAHIPTAENVIVEQGAFFDKYNAHFREEAQSMFGRVFCVVTGHARAPHSFVSTVRAGLSSAASTLASTQAFVEAVASVSQLVEIVSIDASPPKEVASSVKTLQNILNEVPALAELFGSSSASTDVSASSKKKKSTPAKTSSTKHVADLSTVLAEVTRNPAHFAALCAGAVLHWDVVRSLVEGANSAAITQLSGIVNANWKLIFFVKMSLRDGESSSDADFYTWALEQWQNEVSCAEGLQSKASVFPTATQLLAQAALRINVTRFDLRTSDNLLTEKDTNIVVENTTTTPKKSRKRTQSDLSSGDSQSSAVVPVSLIALCQATVNTSLSIAAASGGSPTIAALLSNATILDSLCSAGWFGQWVRRVLSAAVHVAVRSHASSTASKKAVQKITNTSPELAQLWLRLGEILVQSKLHLSDNTASAELQDLALSLTKLVDLPALRALVVDSAVNTQSLADLARLEVLQGTAKDAPDLTRLDTVLEDVLRSASIPQIAGAVRAQLEGEQAESSAAASVAPLAGVVIQLNATSSYYFDPVSLLRSSDIATAVTKCQWSGVSSKAADLLKITQSNAQLLVPPQCGKASLQQLLQALVLEVSLPDALRSGEVSVLEAADLLSHQWTWASAATAGSVTRRINEVVTEITTKNVCGLSAAGLTLLTEATQLLSATTTKETAHILVQYLTYLLHNHLQADHAAKNEVPLLLLPIVAAHKLMRGPGIELALWAQWTRAFVSIFVFTMDSALATLSELSSTDASTEGKNALWRTLSGHLRVLEYLINIPDARVASSRTMQETLTESAVALKKKVNKLVKSALKNGIETPAVLLWVSKLQVTLHRHATEESTVLVGSVLQPSEEDFYHPRTLFDLIPGHSKFPVIVNPARDHQHAAKVPLLKLILQLTQIVCPAGSVVQNKKSVVDASQHFLLAEVLLATYGGTMSESDRITLRILTLLFEAGRSPPLCTLQPRLVGQVLNPAGLRSAEENIANCARWMVEGITPPLAYSTLSRFPMWRSMVPQPLAGLETVNGDDESESALDAAQVDTEWSGAASKKDSDMEVDDEENEDEEDNYRENHEAEEDAQVVFKSDPLLQCSDKVLDPAFYMPVFLFVLRNREVSIRQLANGGGLSLIISSLGSPCALLRTCALACLQYVLNMLHQQNPTRDAAFRERAQLLLLLTYIRNAFDNAEEDRTSAPRLPLTMAVFLGRASMNVMQANHELFSRVNKYLLARPFCDVKDVPLYDLLLVNGDAQSDQMQRLSALRLFRDGLLTKQDHLNLCRKNAYNRLMLLFPLLAKDVRAGHAVLDLLDKGLCLKVSARYLLERCRLAAWVKLLAAPTGAMQLVAKVSGSSETAQEANNTNESATRSFRRPDAASHFSKYLVRAVTLLRRMIASAHLLSCEDVKAKVHLYDLHRILVSVANDAVSAVSSGYADLIPVEYFAQLLLCMWDISSVLQKSALHGATAEIWDVELISGLLSAIKTKFGDAPSTSRMALNQEELVVSLLLLLKHTVTSDSNSKLTELMSHLQTVSQHFLLDASSAKGGPHVGALGIVRPAFGHAARMHTNAPHGLFDKLSDLPYYTNICHVLSAVLSSATIGIDESDFQGRFEFTWNVAGNADFNKMQALPTTLGRHFVLHCVADLLFTVKPHQGGANQDSLTGARWSLVMYHAFLKTAGGKCGMADLSAYAVDRTMKQALNARLVAAELLSKSETAAENPFQPLVTSLHLCDQAARALFSSKVFPVVGEVVKCLKTIEVLLQKLFNSDRVLDPSVLRNGNLVCSLQALVSQAFSYLSGLQTVQDSLSFHERSVESLDVAMCHHLMDVSTRMVTVVVAFQEKFDVIRQSEHRSNVAISKDDGLHKFILGALESDKFTLQLTPAQKHLTLCAGAAYIPHLAVRALKKAPRAARQTASLDDYIDGGEDANDNFDADEEVDEDQEHEGESDVELEDEEQEMLSDEGSSGEEDGEFGNEETDDMLV